MVEQVREYNLKSWDKSVINRVAFSIDGDRLVGNLHVPESGTGLPAVVVAGPMTSVKEQVTGVYAAALAERGIVAFAIDHRGFGESEGAPRQYEDWRRKVDDLTEALSVLATASPRIDANRLGAAAICLGCGYAAKLASQDKRVKSLGLVAGYYRDPKRMRDNDPEAFDAKVAQGVAAREHYIRTRDVLTIPAAALDGDAAMGSADTLDYYTRRAAVPNYVNSFAVMSREVFLPFDVQEIAPLVSVPVAMVHAEKALSPSLAAQFYDRLSGPKVFHKLISQGQTDFYDDQNLVAQSADALAQHFLTNS
jgi:uncharacterized protein